MDYFLGILVYLIPLWILKDGMEIAFLAVCVLGWKRHKDRPWLFLLLGATLKVLLIGADLLVVPQYSGPPYYEPSFWIRLSAGAGAMCLIVVGLAKLARR